MLNEKNQEKIKTLITQIYQKVIVKKRDKIIAWQWINLLSLIVLAVNLFVTIFSFIVTYDYHFAMEKEVFLPLAISFLLITFANIIAIIFLKKRQQKLIEQIKIRLNQDFCLKLYNHIFQVRFKTLAITAITAEWTIKPTNLPALSEFKINDNIIVGQYQTNNFNLGSVSQTTATVIDNLRPNLIPKPYNMQSYRYLCLTITSPSLPNQHFEITRKNQYQKNNLTFDNFFWYDHANKDLSPARQELILANITATKLIPNIKVNNQTWSLQLATSSTNNSKDNDHSLLNFNISLNQKIMLKNFFLTINHDCEIFEKSLVWFNLMTNNN